MKNRLVILSIMSLLIFFSIANGEDNIWINFVRNPNEFNYEICQRQVQDSLSGRYDRFKSPAYLDLMENYLFGKVLSLSRKGNTYARHLCFQFYPLFQGNSEYLEYLDFTLGTLVREDPELFLTLVKKYVKEYDNTPYHLDGMLTNYGEEFVDKIDKQIKETDERIAALQKVDRKDLEELRNRCIERLTEEKMLLVENKKRLDLKSQSK